MYLTGVHWRFQTHTTHWKQMKLEQPSNAKQKGGNGHTIQLWSKLVPCSSTHSWHLTRSLLASQITSVEWTVEVMTLEELESPMLFLGC